MLRRLALSIGVTMLSFGAAAELPAQPASRPTSDARAATVGTPGTSPGGDGERGGGGDLRKSLSAPIYFEFDRDDLTAAARAILAEKLAIMRANPDVHLCITGYADPRGPADHNRLLAQRRAAAARRFLTQRGIASERIVIRSAGEDEMTDSAVPAGRIRRAEFATLRGTSPDAR